MTDKEQNKPISAAHSFRYSEKQDIYDMQLRHKKCRWWLLLFLLPLLLLIQCHKDVTVVCIDADTGEPIAEQEVSLSYDAHFLFKSGFFTTESVNMKQTTDESGKTVFRKVPCSVFSYLFYCMSDMTVSAKSECYSSASTTCNFHYTSEVELKMKPLREDLYVKLLDKETHDPLPGATLIYTYVEGGKEQTDSVDADATGVATIPQMRSCSVIKQLLGRCYGYADTTKVDIPCQNLLEPTNKMALRLRPIKENFTFFVKNKKTRQPIPEARCMVTLTRPSPSKYRDEREVWTSTDGKGKAFYSDAPIVTNLDIVASKEHYKDGRLEGGPWTVDRFMRQNDSIRTIWLEPEPFQKDFVNIDSITKRGIPGVRNEIVVTDGDGKTHTYKEISNSNGVFSVWAEEDSKIEIVSTQSPCYHPKKTTFERFGDLDESKATPIPMMPVMETLTFRTVENAPGSPLLPQCQLRVEGSVSGPLAPNNSGNGTFDVTFRRCEELKITATKTDYEPNSTKVNGQDWDYLSVNQERRDIPLTKKLDPCNVSKAGQTNVKAGTVSKPQSYNMGRNQGQFQLTFDTGSACSDCIEVYNHMPGENYRSGYKIWSSGQVVTDGKRTETLSFSHGSVITIVVITGSKDDSVWDYTVGCPLE